MVRGDGIGDLLQHSGFSGAWRSDDQSASALAQRSHHINHTGLNQVRSSFKAEFLDRIDSREILKANRFGVFLEAHPVDAIDRPELRAVPAMGRLRRALN